MTFIKIFLLLLLPFSFSYSQDTGKIIPERPTPRPGVVNNYIYHPQKHLAIPGKVYASIVYEINEKYYFKKTPVSKINGKFRFSFNTPDSVEVLIIGINDERNNPVDNNGEIGFISYLYDKKGKIPASAYIAAMSMLSYDAIRPLKLNYEKLKPVMINLFEKAYRMAPVPDKEKPYYTYYLTLLYQVHKDIVKPELVHYAEEMASSMCDETEWMNAIKIYQLLDKHEERQILEKKALAAYPDGEIAKSKFIDDFEAKEQTEKSILAAIKDYVNRFKDTSTQMKYTFYGSMIRNLIAEKEYNRLPVYEPQVLKISLASIYDKTAWQLCGGGQLNKNGSDIDIAEMLSRKSLDFLEALRDSSESNDEDDGNFQNFYNKCAATYALILYKLGKFDSAFYYQDTIYKQGNNLDISGIEHYISYAEKAKGAGFAYHIAVHQLLSGISSPFITDQLGILAKKSGTKDSAYISLKIKAANLSSNIASQKIKKIFGTEKSRNFILKNLKGQTVSLASLRNKVVVLDFWATWCVPCRASFPAMKETIDLYKNDSDIVFLFIDTWEHKSPEKMQEQVAKFMNEEKYDFEVLLDEKNKMSDDYKVTEIPARFILNKNGNIVSMGESSNLAADIENAKK